MLHAFHGECGETVSGLAILSNKLYTISSSATTICEYDLHTFKLILMRNISGLSNPQDIASCSKRRCLYITDAYDDSVCRFEIEGHQSSKWKVGDQPFGISVESKEPFNVWVTCLYSQKLFEYTTHGELVCCIVLQPSLVHPHHVVRMYNKELVVCHGFWSTDPLHRVCFVRSNGRAGTGFGNKPGTGTDQFNHPCHLATDGNQFVLVADRDNNRVRLLDSTLGYIRDVVSLEFGLSLPHRLCIDSAHKLLVVAENVYGGRVLIFEVGDLF